MVPTGHLRETTPLPSAELPGWTLIPMFLKIQSDLFHGEAFVQTCLTFQRLPVSLERKPVCKGVSTPLEVTLDNLL